MNRKKYIKAFIVILILFFILFFAFCRRPAISYDKDSFIAIKDSYTEIAKLIYNDYTKNHFDGIYSYGINSNKTRIFCYSSNNNLILNNSEYKSLNKILDNFRLDKHSLSRIYAYNKFITFGTESGRASFVYSANDTRPQYVNTPDDNMNHIYIEKIMDNWYYVCTRR